MTTTNPPPYPTTSPSYMMPEPFSIDPQPKPLPPQHQQQQQQPVQVNVAFQAIPGPTAATRQQPAQPMRFRPDYLRSAPGIIYIVLIIFQLAALISSAVALYLATYAILFFTITDTMFVAALFFIFLFNLTNVATLNRVPWKVVAIVFDLYAILPHFILAILCAVYEANYGFSFRRGAFAATSVFSFLCAFLYLAHILVYMVPVLRQGRGDFSLLTKND